MDTLSYNTSVADAIPPKLEYSLIKMATTNYSNESRPVIASGRKLLCMSAKQPNVLRVLSRQGKHADFTVKSSRVTHVCSTESSPLHPALFYATGGHHLSILSPGTQASGDFRVSVVDAEFDEDLYASAAGDVGALFVLSASQVIEVDETTGAVKGRLSLSPKTRVKYPTFDYHHEAKLLLVPDRGTSLNLLSNVTQKSVLHHAWEPHGDSLPTFTHFFQLRQLPEEGDGVLLFTATAGNSVLRFWSFNPVSAKFTLKQELHVTTKDSTEEDFDVSVTAREEYITLTSRREAFAVVIELHQSFFKAHRVTTWKTEAPAFCSAAQTGKMAMSSQSKSISEELYLTVCTAGGYAQSILDRDRLTGASNTAGMKPDAVTNWFANANASNDEVAAARNTQLTSVSSSLRDSKASSAISESTAASIIRAQAQKFCEQVKLLDQEVMTLQKKASGAMCMLQDSHFREEAQTAGRQFAVRNKSRLESKGTATRVESPVATGMMTESQQELILSIRNFVKEVEGSSAKAASTALKTLLEKQLKQAVAKASKGVGAMDITGSIAMNIGSTESNRVFRKALDQVSQQILSSVRESNYMMQATLETSAAESNAVIHKASAFNNKLVSTIALVHRDLSELRSSLSQLHATAHVAPADPEALVARAVASAEAGDWAAAFTVALESSDITVLLNFLGSKVCEENESVILSPRTLSLPLFLSLCLQLTFEMADSTGTIPLRVQLLHRFYMEWDEHLHHIKTQASKDSRQAPLFDIVKRELSTVYEYMSEVDINLLDRKSRNRFRLVEKLIKTCLSDA